MQVDCAIKPYFVAFKTQNSPKRAFTETKLQKKKSSKNVNHNYFS